MGAAGKNMRVSNEKSEILQDLILSLFTSPFDEALVSKAGSAMDRLAGAQYFSLLCFLPHRSRSRPLVVSNNPKGYNSLYFSVMNRDFLLKSVMDVRAKEYVVRRNTDYLLPENTGFLRIVQDVRPVSDIAYFPFKTSGSLTGLWSLSREGVRSPAFSPEDIELFRFLAPFLNEALKRSILPPPVEEDIAYLDKDGNPQGAGSRIREAFKELFGAALLDPVRLREHSRHQTFKQNFRSYLLDPFSPGKDTVALAADRSRYVFRFSLLNCRSLFREAPGVPFASVRLLPIEANRYDIDAISVSQLSKRLNVTPREGQVIQCIFKGLSNKSIAAELGVEESTVKRYSHNIYEKTGFRSRAELILGLGRKL